LTPPLSAIRCLTQFSAWSRVGWVGILWHELMGKRGPQPVGLGLLTFWEFEFYKALHLLRDGTQLPAKYGPPMGLTPAELRTFIAQLKRMSAEQYWLTTRRVAVELGEAMNLKRPPLRMDLLWAEQERDEEVYRLERGLKPRSIEAQARRRKMWRALVGANTYAALRKVCGRWAQLPDVRRLGMTSFPQHVLENAAQFLFMKRNRRFPRSNYGDDARLDYLARGMAGVLCGVSPMTGIERLRNMKHDRGGPLWVTRQGDYTLPETEQHCGCWRCSIKRSNKVTQVSQMWYENGLKLFMELAGSTKVPSEWTAKTKNINPS
jgi:hypothetical protein